MLVKIDSISELNIPGDIYLLKMKYDSLNQTYATLNNKYTEKDTHDLRIKLETTKDILIIFLKYNKLPTDITDVKWEVV